MDERRAMPRRRILKSGTIEFSGQAIECAARNITASGAALEIRIPLWFPDQFILSIASEGVHRFCQVVWRRERKIGAILE